MPGGTWTDSDETWRAGYTLHLMDKDRAWSYPGHVHTDVCELVVLQHGILHQEINGTAYDLYPGEMVLLRDGDYHTLSGNNFSYVNIMFQPSWLDRMEVYTQIRGLRNQLLASPELPKATVPDADRDDYFESIDELRFNQRHDYGRQVFAHFILLTVTRYLAPVIRAAIPAGTPDWLAETVAWIHMHNENPPSISDIVTHSCRCQEHLTRQFTRWLGTSPSRYLAELRIDRAAELLATTSYTVQEISHRTGFDNQSYFFRLFSRQKGMTPLAWRRAHGPRSIQSR